MLKYRNPNTGLYAHNRRGFFSFLSFLSLFPALMRLRRLKTDKDLCGDISPSEAKTLFKASVRCVYAIRDGDSANLVKGVKCELV